MSTSLEEVCYKQYIWLHTLFSSNVLLWIFILYNLMPFNNSTITMFINIHVSYIFGGICMFSGRMSHSFKKLLF